MSELPWWTCQNYLGGHVRTTLADMSEVPWWTCQKYLVDQGFMFIMVRGWQLTAAYMLPGCPADLTLLVQEIQRAGNGAAAKTPWFSRALREGTFGLLYTCMSSAVTVSFDAVLCCAVPCCAVLCCVVLCYLLQLLLPSPPGSIKTGPTAPCVFCHALVLRTPTPPRPNPPHAAPTHPDPTLPQPTPPAQPLPCPADWAASSHTCSCLMQRTVDAKSYHHGLA